MWPRDEYIYAPLSSGHVGDDFVRQLHHSFTRHLNSKTKRPHIPFPKVLLAENHLLSLYEKQSPSFSTLQQSFDIASTMQFLASSFITLVALGLSRGAAAVCSGSTSGYAIGSAVTSSTSTKCELVYPFVGIVAKHSCATTKLTVMTDTVYSSSSCAVRTVNSYSTTAGICDNPDFLCTPGTKNIAEYDDPISGWAYKCTADTTSESCAGDVITYCVSPRSSGQEDLCLYRYIMLGLLTGPFCYSVFPNNCLRLATLHS